MAPKRKTSGPAAARSQQSTLTFNGRSSKITKPSATTPSTKAAKKLDAADIPTPPETSQIDVEDIADTSAEKAVLEQAQEEAERVAVQKTPEEEEASKITEAQIKKYWREKESKRMVKRIHQEDVSVHERVLREFDITSQYGPSIGIARMKRWQRAHRLGLKPPMEVLAVLLKEQEADNIKAQRSHVDELMSSRFNES
ncbi:hypothetical protein NA57DRAFT_63921 [Rhizodiscina lignyota]|uniref:DNA polymerase delta subunit 4 n=1 Tax=Rhizodiscina lignyota TaxID=1504668 RepID=A0A9P4IRU9_9PEZI|nr:hypothetical protein NA57DRAFT_63921 [Rhizodiscina lignyota]